MPSREELIAANKDLMEMCKHIEASSLKFLSIDGLYKAIFRESRNKTYPQLTDHYFTGDYPVDLVDQIKDDKITQLSLLSGKSSN